MDILNRIRQLRDERGWSNYRLAKEANLSEGSVNNLFRLKNQPTVSTLQALCVGFGISLSQFFADAEDAVMLDSEQRELLTIWNRLTKEQKRALLVLIKQM